MFSDLGIDGRNQFDFFASLGRGFGRLVTELHQAGVKVLLSFNVWDTLTRDQGGGSLRNGQALGRFASSTGADGFLMDTYVGTTATLHSACPHSALESEGYTNSSSTSYQTMADAKWTGHEAVWADLDPPTAPAAVYRLRV